MRLERLDTLEPARDNPRVTDEARLALVALSLQKFGWLLPVYATNAGVLLSGHQRRLAAMRLGWTHAPVERVDIDSVAARNANILFNRGTNDFAATDTSTAALDRLLASDPYRTLAATPDVAAGYAPCMAVSQVPIAVLIAANAGKWNDYATSVAKALSKFGVRMPVIIDESHVIHNGLGRVVAAAERGSVVVDAVILRRAEAAMAGALLNGLSMEFNLHECYADTLRHNSFSRARNARRCLGRGFYFALAPNATDETFDIDTPGVLQQWRRTYGSTVLDFGAGRMVETRILQERGIDVVPFEPFCLTNGDVVDTAQSHSVAVEFLRRVAAGTVFSSMFVSVVMNSVPFRRDREHIVRILSSLCDRRTRVYAHTVSDAHPQALAFQRGRTYANAGNARRLQFALDYESNILLGDFGALPKVQKYHSPDEWLGLWSTGFETVRDSAKRHYVQVVASHPVPVNRERLRDALAFEFDLPYPDGSRMGLAELAIDAWRTRGVL